jgi:hypothetical protein
LTIEEAVLNTQEREELTRFLKELVQAQAGAKDAEAERMIRENCNYQPDASYLLVQRVLLLEQALKKSQADNAGLQKELAAARGTTASFLGDTAWGNTPQPAAHAPVAPVPAAGATPPPAPAAAPGGGVLGTVATTAAGVVAGSLLFQGIERMMGHAPGSGFVSRETAAPEKRALGDAGELDADGDLASLIPDEADLDSV